MNEPLIGQIKSRAALSLFSSAFSVLARSNQRFFLRQLKGTYCLFYHRYLLVFYAFCARISVCDVLFFYLD